MEGEGQLIGWRWGSSARTDVTGTAITPRGLTPERRASMYSYLQSSCVVTIGLIFTGLAVWILDRMWPTTRRKPFNDVIGWQLGVLGTTYAVILGFMLSSVWGNYIVAFTDVDAEATADLGVFRAAENLPALYADQLRNLAERYASVVIHGEWQAMAAQEQPNQGEAPIAAMWVVASGANRALPPESANASAVRSAIRLLQDRREQRLEQYRRRLPFIMWTVLLTGAILVVGSACLSGNEKMLLHVFHVISLSLLLLLTLAAMADLVRPFEGGASVPPTSFEEVLSRMDGAVNPLSFTGR